MNKQEILASAIEKAVKNGYTPYGEVETGEGYMGSPPKLKQNDGFDNSFTLFTNFGNDRVAYEEIIFNHKFAKAFFGEEGLLTEPSANWICSGNRVQKDREFCFSLPAYAFHLQQMVISEDPILYLKPFLDE